MVADERSLVAMDQAAAAATAAASLTCSKIMRSGRSIPNSIKGSTRSRLQPRGHTAHDITPIFQKPKPRMMALKSHLLATKLRIATQAALTTRSFSR
jgi:hypothetical protein